VLLRVGRGGDHWLGISLLEEVKAIRVAETGATHIRAAPLVMG